MDGTEQVGRQANDAANVEEINRVTWAGLGVNLLLAAVKFVGGMLGSRAQKLFSEKTLKIVLAITLFFLFFRFFKIEIWI